MGSAAMAIGMIATSEFALANRCGTPAHSTCSGTSTKPPPTPKRPPSRPPRKPIAAKMPGRLIRSTGAASRAGSPPRSGAGTGRLTAPRRLAAWLSFSSLPHGPACRVLYPWRPVSMTRASSRKNDSTSVTRPIDCQLPRSASLVTTAGLMSTHTVRTPAGSMLPVAMECSMVESISAMRTPRTDLMEGQRVAGEDPREKPAPDQAGEIAARPGGDQGGSSHAQDAPARLSYVAHLMRDAGDENLLRFLGRDLAAHETEDLGLPGALERGDAHALMADHHLHPRLRVLEDDAPGATCLAVDRDRGVHLDVLN